jgi:hypothetical protein
MTNGMCYFSAVKLAPRPLAEDRVEVVYGPLQAVLQLPRLRVGVLVLAPRRPMQRPRVFVQRVLEQPLQQLLAPFPWGCGSCWCRGPSCCTRCHPRLGGCSLAACWFGRAQCTALRWTSSRPGRGSRSLGCRSCLVSRRAVWGLGQLLADLHRGVPGGFAAAEHLLRDLAEGEVGGAVYPTRSSVMVAQHEVDRLGDFCLCGPCAAGDCLAGSPDAPDGEQALVHLLAEAGGQQVAGLHCGRAAQVVPIPGLAGQVAEVGLRGQDAVVLASEPRFLTMSAWVSAPLTPIHAWRVRAVMSGRFWRSATLEVTIAATSASAGTGARSRRGCPA